MEPKASVAMVPPKPNFNPLKANEMISEGGVVQFRKVPVPAHRLNPLKKAWETIYNLVYEVMKVDIRMNIKGRRVELKNKHDTPDIGHLQKCADFVNAFVLGFEVKDAELLLRYDELFVDSFEIKDVKTLAGSTNPVPLAPIWQIGKTKFAIENATRTRIVIADTRIHILGPFARNKIARNCLCSLILGPLRLKFTPSFA